MTRFNFIIKIGDWSGDGHSICKDFHASSNGNINQVREAYFTAKDKLPKLCPENFCADYQDSNISNKLIAQIKKLSGIDLNEETSPEYFARYVVWFINQGDNSLDIKIEVNNIDTLSFYGVDEKGRHIGFIGYGLFDN